MLCSLLGGDHVFMCTYSYTCHVSKCVFVHIHVHVHVYIDYMYLHTRIYVYSRIYYIHIGVYTYERTHTHTCTHTNTHTHTHTHTRIHIFRTTPLVCPRKVKKDFVWSCPFSLLAMYLGFLCVFICLTCVNVRCVYTFVPVYQKY